MDAHSQLFNDVWKAIHGQFLPSIGMSDLRSLANHFNDPSGVGICIPWLWVAEKFRGRGVSRDLLNATARVCADASRWACRGADQEPEPELQPDEGLEVEEGLDLDLEEELEAMDFAMSPRTMLEDNPIRLYVLPIEGTPLKGSQKIDVLARSSLGREGPRRDVEPAIERRRIALDRHFRRAGDPSEAFYVHTYNPWDYPAT